MSITQQSFGSTAVITDVSVEQQNVTLNAGQNRAIVVAVGGERNNSTGFGANPPIVTYGGVPLAMAIGRGGGSDLVANVAQPPGSVIQGRAFTSLAAVGFGIRLGVFIYILREADMPANGVNVLEVTWPVLANWQFGFGWWVLDGVDQSPEVAAVVTAINDSNTTGGVNALSVPLLPGAASDAVFLCGMNNAPGAAPTLTVNGGAITNDVALNFATRGSTFAAGRTLSVGSAAAAQCDSAYPVEVNRAANLVAIRLRQHDQPIGSASMEISP